MALEETYLPRDFDRSEYLREAEAQTEAQWQRIQSFLGKADVTSVLDFECGWGRIAERFASEAGDLVCCDGNPDSVDRCRSRFANFPNVSCVVSEDLSIPLPDESRTFIYSWDAIVHFNAAELRQSFQQFKRILKPGGMAFVHHSNVGALGGPPLPWNKNAGCRAHLSGADVRMICDQLGLEIVRQQVIDWSQPAMDCLTLFRKP